MTGKADSGSTRICTLNDELRRFGRGGRIMMTPGIQALGVEGVAPVFSAVAAFDAFTRNNDPYGEHDCAVLAVDGIEVLFKIDYYDRDLVYHSPDASDPTVTRRVMVVMLASEYWRPPRRESSGAGSGSRPIGSWGASVPPASH